MNNKKRQLFVSYWEDWGNTAFYLHFIYTTSGTLMILITSKSGQQIDLSLSTE